MKLLALGTLGLLLGMSAHWLLEGSAMANPRVLYVTQSKGFRHQSLHESEAIMEELGDDKQALEAFRRAQAIHPRLKGVADQVKNLADKIEGRDI